MIMHILSGFSSTVEPVLLAAALWVFVRSKAHRELPAFGAYLACRLLVCVALLALLSCVRLHLLERHLAYAVYYYTFWIGYLAGAGCALLATQEIFSYLMKPLPGLGRYGLAAFRWVTVISLLIALATALYPAAQHRNLLVAATGGAMRCISILELCLFAFVLLAMHTLRLSPRNREFGVTLGLATIAAADLFGSAFAFGHSNLGSLPAYVTQLAVTLGVSIWVIYFAHGSRAAAKTLPMPSSLQRWNEIAGALTESAPQISLSAGPNRFFLQDVERAVDRVLEKNSGNPSQ